MKIGGMGLARIECDDHSLAGEIDFYISHPANFLQDRSELSHALVAVFAFGRDFDRLQDGVIGAFRIEWIGRIGLVWSCGVHRLSLS
ncbi:MAG TPA: hypothetical protein VGH06_05960, partial [Candidatus Udaeobacter sp.]